MLFLLSIKIKLDIEKSGLSLSGTKNISKVFYPKYFHFEFKTLHIENSKLAYETITWMECKPWVLTEMCTLTHSDGLLSLIILEEIKPKDDCTYNIFRMWETN